MIPSFNPLNPLEPVRGGEKRGNACSFAVTKYLYDENNLVLSVHNATKNTEHVCRHEEDVSVELCAANRTRAARKGLNPRQQKSGTTES